MIQVYRGREEAASFKDPKLMSKSAHRSLHVLLAQSLSNQVNKIILIDSLVPDVKSVELQSFVHELMQALRNTKMAQSVKGVMLSRPSNYMNNTRRCGKRTYLNLRSDECRSFHPMEERAKSSRRSLTEPH